MHACLTCWATKKEEDEAVYYVPAVLDAEFSDAKKLQHHRQKQQSNPACVTNATVARVDDAMNVPRCRVNLLFGINDLAFSIGDDSIADFVSSIQFLPIVQMVRETNTEIALCHIFFRDWFCCGALDLP